MIFFMICICIINYLFNNIKFCLMVSPQNITENVLINEAYWVSVTKEVLHLESFVDFNVKFLQDTKHFI